MVGISFIRDVQDISVLRQELKKRKLNDQLGIVLKIETESGFENLPLILLEAMKCLNPLGVMIARGDLAVECGWERLANIQEEILAICKVGRVPVILATQVLESLVKSGVPTRAEITDAANGRRLKKPFHPNLKVNMVLLKLSLSNYGVWIFLFFFQGELCDVEQRKACS